MELYASISTRNINFVSFLFSSICKVAPTAYDFTQCVYRHHCFRAHFGRATIGKDKLIPFFQTQSAMFCFSFYYCQLELPIFSAPFLHINILRPIVCLSSCFIASFSFVIQRHRAKPIPPPILNILYHKSAEKTRVLFRLRRSDIIATAIVILKPLRLQ